MGRPFSAHKIRRAASRTAEGVPVDVKIIT
jgi:hypothetical protein